MSVRVITPPDPIVEPSDIAGAHSANDASVAAMIAAVTEEIDGPTGWLGRCLGPQTLEWSDWIGCRRTMLPCRPIIKIESVVAVDSNGNETTVDPTTYRLDGDCIVVADGAAWVVSQQHRIVYQAGYNGTGAGKTGEIPERARQAIILSVQHLKSLSVESLYLRSVEIPDVETRQFTLSDQASNIVERTCDRLLSTLRVY